jgi:hypothetical protein
MQLPEQRTSSAANANSFALVAGGFPEFQQASHPSPKRRRLRGFEPVQPDGNKNVTKSIF